MTTTELRALLEPLILDCINAGRKPGRDVAEVAKRWLGESGFDPDEAMNQYNLVVAGIIRDHNLQRN